MYYMIVSDIQTCVLCITVNEYVWMRETEVSLIRYSVLLVCCLYFCTCAASTQLLRPEHGLCWPCDLSDSVVTVVVKGLRASSVPHSPLWLALCAAPPGSGNESVTPWSSFYSSAWREKEQCSGQDNVRGIYTVCHVHWLPNRDVMETLFRMNRWFILKSIWIHIRIRGALFTGVSFGKISRRFHRAPD